MYTIVVAMFNYEMSEGDNYALTIQDQGEILLGRYQKVSEEIPGFVIGGSFIHKVKRAYTTWH